MATPVRTFRLSDGEWDEVWSILSPMGISDTATLMKAIARRLVILTLSTVRDKPSFIKEETQPSAILPVEEEADEPTYDSTFDWGA